MSAAEIALRKILEKFNQEKYKNEDISLKALTSGGANYTSALFSVTIISKLGENLKLFAKVANVNRDLRNLMNIRLLFETEQFVYNNLAETYGRIQEKHNLDPEHIFTFPKFFGGDDTDGEEVVILEDLISKGYQPYSRFKSIDWDHMASCVKVLARFHALSFAFAKEEPENFAEAVEKVKFRMQDNRNNPVMKETRARIANTAVQVAREGHRENIRKILDPDMSIEDIYKFRMPLSTPVLCHGDFRISNILFKKQNGCIETIVVDYQTLHTGCPAIDLLYLEFMGTDEEFRRDNHERLLNHYFEELAVSLDRLSLDVTEVYPRETFDKELREMMPAALRTASFVLPLVLVEEHRAPKFSNSSVEDFALSPTQQFAERYSGLVSDCVRWGVI